MNEYHDDMTATCAKLLLENGMLRVAGNILLEFIGIPWRHRSMEDEALIQKAREILTK